MKKHGVTIVELLVVLGVVGALLAVGTSATVSVRREARSAMCSSNLKQIAMATESYRNQYAGWLPAAVLYRVQGGELVTSAWDFEQTNSGTVRPSMLWSFADGPSNVHQCPDYSGPSNFGADPFTGYNYNTTYLGSEGRMPWMGANGNLIQGWEAARLGAPPALHRAPDRCALYGDAGWRGGANKFMRAPSNTVEHDLGMVYAGGQAFRHSDCCNVVHLDGHCSRYTQPCQGPHDQENLLQDIMDFPSNGFLSEDDSAYDPNQ